ncbi:hypothetical protein K504DRAFT_299308 [Pleomassaria siparia CBS 279.74]|uniref:Uncharacterized protein n=1 Tax=Pleomassaria siparia CBS 279.74 TaxID=1314801 RepID=A0A6G1K5F3_9PLEO|nr:hypothetical protein K504DRAFT_299308 [Pleomassaria siparia CBS 279.74]
MVSVLRHSTSTDIPHSRTLNDVQPFPTSLEIFALFCSFSHILALSLALSRLKLLLYIHNTHSHYRKMKRKISSSDYEPSSLWIPRSAKRVKMTMDPPSGVPATRSQTVSARQPTVKSSAKIGVTKTTSKTSATSSRRAKPASSSKTEYVEQADGIRRTARARLSIIHVPEDAEPFPNFEPLIFEGSSQSAMDTYHSLSGLEPLSDPTENMVVAQCNMKLDDDYIAHIDKSYKISDLDRADETMVHVYEAFRVVRCVQAYAERKLGHSKPGSKDKVRPFYRSIKNYLDRTNKQTPGLLRIVSPWRLRRELIVYLQFDTKENFGDATDRLVRKLERHWASIINLIVKILCVMHKRSGRLTRGPEQRFEAKANVGA